MVNIGARVDRDDWDQHWESYAQEAEQNPAQRYRRQLVQKLLVRYGCSNASHILDIGSGQGDMASALRIKFPEAEVAGAELSTKGVEVAAHKVPSATFFQRDLLKPCNDIGPLRSWAQFAVCSEVLEHVDYPKLFLENAGDYLAPGAVLVVTVPGGPKSKFDLHIGHRRHYTPASLGDLLTSSGFSVDLVTTAGFPFFNLYRLLVILRGSRLITDVDCTSRNRSPVLARIVMAFFRVLFTMNLVGTTLGWQTIAVGRKRDTGAGQE